MGSSHEIQDRRLSSEGTAWWRDIFPTVWGTGVGIVMMGVWMEWWGRPATLELKVFGIAVWIGTSILFALLGRTLHDVWLRDDRLVVSGKDGRYEIRLEDITGFSETRGQKIKSIQIKLRAGHPRGSGIRFVPPLQFQTPFTEHPMIREIKDQKELLAGKQEGERLSP